MGLDMYLYAQQTLFNNPYRGSEDEKATLRKIDKLTYGTAVSDFFTLRVSKTVGYWRKANAIHRFFLQGNVDDGRPIPVSRERLSMLLQIVNNLLQKWREDPAEAVSQAKIDLPTQSGFFFGSTAYDECYFADLRDTRKILTTVLADFPDSPYVSFSYQASW